MTDIGQLTKGMTVEMEVESGGLGTATFAAGGHVRFNSLDTPWQEVQVEEQPNLGHADAMDRPDEPQVYQEGQLDAIKMQLMIRRGVDGTTAPPLITLAESAGCAEDHGDSTTVATYTGPNFTLTADEAADGRAILVQDTANIYRPVLCQDYTSPTVTPSMAMATAAAASDVVQRMYTITPTYDEVNAAKTIGLRINSRASHTTSDDWARDFIAAALGSIGEIHFEPNGTPTIDLSIHFGKMDKSADALPTVSFLDGAKFSKCNGYTQLGFADYNAAGGIANTEITWRAVDIDLALATEACGGEGSGTVGGWQGFGQAINQPTVKITRLIQKATYDNIKASLTGGVQTRKYIHLIQPTTNLAEPAWGFWFPQCYLTAIEGKADGTWIEAVETYAAAGAGYGAKNTILNKPWYAAISGEHSA